MKRIIGKVTIFGFKWGSLEVDRFMSDEKEGWVCLGLSTPKRKLELYAAKDGKLRLYEIMKDGTKKEIDINPRRED